MGLLSFLFGTKRNFYREITEAVVRGTQDAIHAGFQHNWENKHRMIVNITLPDHITEKEMIDWMKNANDIIQYQNEVNISDAMLLND